MKSLAKILGMIAMAYLAFEYDSVLCGIASFMLFVSVLED